jgi:hypothetical protein
LSKTASHPIDTRNRVADRAGPLTRLRRAHRRDAVLDRHRDAGRRLCNRNLCTLANNFCDAGFTPLIDTVIPDREQLSLCYMPVSRSS